MFVLEFPCSSLAEPSIRLRLQAINLAAQGAGVVGILLGPPEMLQKPVLKKPSTASESWRIRFIMLAGPEELTI